MARFTSKVFGIVIAAMVAIASLPSALARLRQATPIAP